MSFEVKQDQIVITQELVDDYKCQQCDYTTRTKERFLRHMMSVHLNSRCGNIVFDCILLRRQCLKSAENKQRVMYFLPTHCLTFIFSFIFFLHFFYQSKFLESFKQIA